LLVFYTPTLISKIGTPFPFVIYITKFVFIFSKTRGFDVEEKLIYQIIENSENKGI